MMLKRKIEKEIMHWIESSDKALLIYGVRQAGKTFIIRECLKAAGCDYIEFNLIRQPEIVEILAGATSTDDLILKLSLYSDQKIVPGKTVFFFDEIQKYKEIPVHSVRLTAGCGDRESEIRTGRLFADAHDVPAGF